MKNNKGRQFFIAFCILHFTFCISFVSAQKKKADPPPPTVTNLLFLFDASGSMNAKWQSGPKIDVAKMMMNQLLDSLRYIPNLQLALRVYGHQKPFPPQDCDDTRL